MDEHYFTLGVDLACSAAHCRRRSPTPLAGWCGRTNRVPYRHGPAGAVVGEAGSRWGATAAGDRADPKRAGAVGGMVSGARRHGDLVPPEQSADLRRYYQKHTKYDRLDSALRGSAAVADPEPRTCAGPQTPAHVQSIGVQQRQPSQQY